MAIGGLTVTFILGTLGFLYQMRRDSDRHDTGIRAICNTLEFQGEEQIKQGKAIARIEGGLGLTPAPADD